MQKDKTIYVSTLQIYFGFSSVLLNVPFGLWLYLISNQLVLFLNVPWIK